MAFAIHQFFKDCQDLFAIGVNALQIVAEPRLEAGRFHPFFNQRLRDIDVAPERIERMAAQKQPIEHCGFPLRRQWIEVIPDLFKSHCSPPQKQQYSQPMHFSQVENWANL